MFDVQGFLTLLDEIEKKRKRSAGQLHWQQVENDLVLSRQRQKPGPKPRNKAPHGSGKPKTGGKPYTGSTPVRSAIDDEWRKRRNGGGGSGAASTSVPAARPLVSSPTPTSPLTASPGVRSAIASGSQPAVVKLISFAAGQSRIGALLNYQSRGGEIAAEDDAGQQLGGGWVQEIADEWSEEDGRQASKDVLRLFVTIPGSLVQDEQAVANMLIDALPGHRIAWRQEHDSQVTRLELVISAAARKQPDEETPGRIFDNRKSFSRLEGAFERAFGNSARVEVHGFAHGVEGVARYLGQLRKGGRHDLYSLHPNSAGGLPSTVKLTGSSAAIDEARNWKRDLRSQERRDVAHIVLSARPGTPKEAFVAASRAMLAREFAGHRYVFALHQDRAHLHVHAVVQMRSETGSRLHPKVQDFKRWRETLAEEARERNIPMDAASRFERANPPGFKMKDVRRLERGEANESTRRRVERVRNGEVHVPTRQEGMRRAELTARAWSEASRTAIAAMYKPEPPQRPGIIRLYRAERAGQPASSQPLFTRDRAAAAQIAVRDGATLRFIDIASYQLHILKPSRKDPHNVFLIDRQTAATAEIISPEHPQELARFQSRTELAVALSQTIFQSPHHTQSTSAITVKDAEMADLKVMKTSFEQMDRSLDEIEKKLPDDKIVEFEELGQKAKAKQKTMLGAQETIEKRRGKIEGDSYVPPKPVELQNFVAEQRGADMRYSHRKADGRAGAVAFTDHGDKVEIGNWRDREVVLAAMQVASEK